MVALLKMEIEIGFVSNAFVRFFL